jgi:ribosomal protein S18 acetylase RimI-like enzyme
MEIKTLENTPVAVIASTFNEAFSDYFIRLQFTEESMAAKMKSEGILLRYSVGAFEGGQLVGFILNGYDMLSGVKTIYNAGTGVIPSYRGKRITTSLYEYAIHMLAREGIYSHLLEVIDNNHPAMHVYEKIGFKKGRKLLAFKNDSSIQGIASFQFKQLNDIPPEAIVFSNMEAAWQNSLASVERAKTGHQLLGAFDNEKLVGFAAYVPTTGRVKQLAVHPDHRRKGVGTTLLQFIQQNTGATQLVITNVDENYEPAIMFLRALGFQVFLSLYEMKLTVERK